MANTNSERQKRYQERHPERVAAYHASESYKRSFAERQARYRAKNPGRTTMYRKANPEKVLARDAEYRARVGTHPQNVAGSDAYKVYRASAKYRRTYSNGHLRRTYGITIEEYEVLLVQQGSVCKICLGKDERKFRKGQTTWLPLFVDHCHTTGRVRGLLCGKCNSGIGMFKENKALLNNAIAYLKES